MNRLIDKWVLITGATSGIGRESAILFAQNGANLILTGRREDHLIRLKEELEENHSIEVQTNSFDVRNRAECKKCVDSIEQSIDILLNNAGLAAGKGKIDDADFDDWDAMIDTNIKGLLSMTQYVSARMRKQNSGHIINVGSIAGYEAYPGGSVYCATKHAVRAITQAAKMDLSGTRVRVSSVSPGLVNTEFSQVRFRGNQKEADEVYKNITPLTGADVAEIIIFIANRPPHVNILDSIVFPVAQSSATIVARNKQL